MKFKLAPSDPLESDRQAGIVRYLQLENRVKFFIRINGGGRMMKGTFIWFYRLFVGPAEAKGKGVSDIIGMLRDGRFFAIECKRPLEYLTKEQTEFLENVRAGGGIAGVARNWIEARSLVRNTSGLVSPEESQDRQFTPPGFYARDGLGDK